MRPCYCSLMHDQRPVRYRVRFDRLDQLLEDLGYVRDEDKSEYLGCSRVSLQRLRRNEVEPSVSFMARCQSTFPALRHEALFELVYETAPKALAS